MKKLLKTYKGFNSYKVFALVYTRFKTPGNQNKSKGTLQVTSVTSATSVTSSRPSEVPRPKNQEPRPISEKWIQNKSKGTFQVTSSHDDQYLSPSPWYQDPFPRPKNQEQDPSPKSQNGMVKLLPIPSLKKVRITKTKTQQKNRPKTQDSPRNLLKFQDMMLQNAHGPVPLLPLLPLLPLSHWPKKEIIPWLCTSIASPLRIKPRGKRSSGKSPKELRRERTPRSARIVLGL
jgi:hypothetical protein